jgi:hypothetical protein
MVSMLTSRDFIRAKTELIDIRIREKKRDLMPTETAIADMERLIDIVLTQMSGMSARIGGHDLHDAGSTRSSMRPVSGWPIPSISSRTRLGNRP